MNLMAYHFIKGYFMFEVRELYSLDIHIYIFCIVISKVFFFLHIVLSNTNTF